jgi:cytochrome b561
LAAALNAIVRSRTVGRNRSSGECQDQYMTQSATPTQRYNTTALTLHWVMAALMAINVALIWFINMIPDNWVRPAIDTHKSTGILILGLVILRVLWRMARTPPPLEEMARWEKTAAHLGHFTLYVLMFALPLSGWLHDSAWKDAAKFPMQLFYLMPWPRISWISSLEPETKQYLHVLFGAVHRYLSYIFYALFIAHVLGALKHQFIDGKPELQRMGLG